MMKRVNLVKGNTLNSPHEEVCNKDGRKQLTNLTNLTSNDSENDESSF